jgi:hypothetical protein
MSANNWRLPTDDDVESGFYALTLCLSRYRLPAGPDNEYRQADPGEFMLMDVVTNFACAQPRYRFKHRQSRNYLYVDIRSDGPDLMVPGDGTPFHLGVFPAE